MRLEAVEFIKIVCAKFCKVLAPNLISLNVFGDLISLFYRYPFTSLLHIKIVDILKLGLKSGSMELVDNIMYSGELVKRILELPQDEDTWKFKFEQQDTSTNHGYFPFLIEIANFLKSNKEDAEISAMMGSIPEWGVFESGLLQTENAILVDPLGGRDPRVKIEQLFDDENGFVSKFKGFKPVPK